MGDYYRHWLEMGKKITNPPKIFHVNWFRTNEEGKFTWPGFGENLRVLKWILSRCEGTGKAVETPIGYTPTVDALDLEGLDLPPETVEELLKVDNEAWQEELAGMLTFFEQFGERLPQEIMDEYNSLKSRLG